MKPLALLDPWAVPFSGQRDDDARLREFRRFTDLVRRAVVAPVPFLPLTARERGRVVPGRFRSEVTALMLFDQGSTGAQASLLDAPVPSDLGEDWLRALHGCIDPSPASVRWRDPFLLVPGARKEKWPRSNEVRIRTSGGEVSRVQCGIDEFGQASLAQRDLNPWLLSPRADVILDYTLPRPPQLDGVPMARWAEALAGIDDWTCGQAAGRYYVPEPTSPLHQVGKDEWRSGKCFKRADRAHHLQCKGEGHYVDRWGRVWCWDSGHRAHWDVSVEGGARYDRVLPDGTHNGTKPSKRG